MKPAQLLLLSVRTVLGAVFVVSGFQKLTTPYQNFAAVIEKFEILKGTPVIVMAQTLPWIELVAGVFLILGFWEALSLGVLWAMNTVFIGALSSVLIRKIELDHCGCFGEAVTLSVPQILSLDVLFWAMFLTYFLFSKRIDVPGADRAFR